MAATLGVQYNDPEACGHPALGLTWETGQSRELPEALALHLIGGDGSPFSRVALTVARAEDAPPTAELAPEPGLEPVVESAASAAEGSAT